LKELQLLALYMNSAHKAGSGTSMGLQRQSMTDWRAADAAAAHEVFALFHHNTYTS